MIGQLTTNQPLDLERTLDCAQGHRWRPEKDHKGKSTGWYTSVLKVHDPKSGDTDKLVRIRQKSNGPVEYEYETVAQQSEIEAKLRCQFRLKDDDEDVRVVYADLECDSQMKALVKDYFGLRVMRVDPWECLVFFILSANADIATTQQRMEAIADTLCEKVSSDVRVRHTFPTYTDIDHWGGEALSQLVDLKFGLDKDAKIYVAAALVRFGRLPLNSLSAMPVEKVTNDLQQLWGVGDKVSNCVALFASDKLDAFPVDTHVEKALNCLYEHCDDLPKTRRAMSGWGKRRFMDYAGYASQFLFKHGYQYRPRRRGKLPL